ncbi:MAG: fluoride efflux transporter CrcB [Dehalococcoidia bacterium]|nr:fluoride efflux transporter CrcB [Dehalococcoidia bacterium]
MTYLYIVAGAVVGAPLRYFIGVRFAEWTGGGFPWGTLVVNVVGCLCIGLLLGLPGDRAISPEARLLLVTGFLGSFTTFSALGFETQAFLRGGEVGKALVYVALSNGGGIAAAWLGWTAAR